MNKLKFYLLLSAFIILCLLAAIQPEPQEVSHVDVHRQINQQEYKKALEEYETPQLVSLGEFKITFYTLAECGKEPNDPGYGITKSGAYVEEGVTCAVDPSVIPLGTSIYIDGIGWRTAQDTGPAVKGNVIDIYITDVSKATMFYRTVYKEG